MEKPQYYKHSKETAAAYNMAKDYDAAEKTEARAKGDFVTMHWAPVLEFENHDFLYVEKPKHLECSVIAKCYPGAVIVNHSDLPWPAEPEE